MMFFYYGFGKIIGSEVIMNKSDVVIIGGGIGGLMCAYRLLENDPDLKVTILEKGKDLKDRNCPLVKGAVKRCAKCKPCAIMEGLAGAGAFSDGKYNITTQYGGWLKDYMDEREVLRYIYKADDILINFGANVDAYQPDNELKLLCLQHDLHMLQGVVKHLGTDANFKTMMKMIDYLREICTIKTEAEVIDVDATNHVVSYVINGETSQIKADKIVFAVGRVGAGFFKKWLIRNNVECYNNQVDIGVRVELPSIIWEHFSKKIYEPKIIYRTRKYKDNVRMFCFNERGYVVTENADGILTVNGHAYKEEDKKSENSNFALLSTINFTSPFREPIEYARSVASLSNKISGGSVLVQRLGDLRDGRRTDEKRLKQSRTLPTLDAVPGDLSLCMPKRQLDNIIETLEALDKVAPGTNNDDTLLYGIECKYYSARPKCNNFMLEGLEDIYAVGDGAGFSRSLSQAAANGLKVADLICGKTI